MVRTKTKKLKEYNKMIMMRAKMVTARVDANDMKYIYM